MVRKFLYAIVVLVVLAFAVALALRLWGDELAGIAFVPSEAFERQAPLAGNAYADPAMWLARPGLAPGADPSRWRPSTPGFLWEAWQARLDHGRERSLIALLRGPGVDHRELGVPVIPHPTEVPTASLR